ncbi:MAG: RagB/SusD family nutrient uptake outer membrane protein [Dysgonamonadaceae bacterium]|nr:RagB/SusD family nutrient uptake outer membrane protein [Dysgonamonadaceae bacterium]
MKRFILYYIAFLPLLFSSCNDWLTVQPEASIGVEELLNSEEGFFEAINGIYTKGADNYFYGGLFTVEIQDALIQNYSFKVQDYTQYVRTSMFDFTDVTFKWRNSLIWNNAYNGIANANLILENIDGKKEIFHEGMYELVKGEALALRAYFHFDLLRYFALPYSSGASSKSIPYVTAYSNRVTPLSTVQEVIDKALSDLNEAKRLLATCDPILKAGYIVGYNNYEEDSQSTEEEGTLFLQNRRHRLNYFAVCGTLARVYLYAGNRTEALANAKEVIDANKFPWVDRDRFLAEEKTRDRLIYPELLFAWYIEKQEENMRNRYENTTTGYFINNDHVKNIYEVATVGADDDRFKSWFSLSTEGNYQIIKYLRNDQKTGNIHYLASPSIRLSEMYYIAAESVYETNPGMAWNYLNTVRTHRGIGTPLDSSDNFQDELLKEYRKETYAEGQAFYAYKRLNKSIRSESGIIFQPTNIAPIPLPDDETEFGNR